MRLTFLGTANAFFSGGRAQGSILAEDSLGRLLLECGVTAPYLLKRRQVDLDSIDSILITHLHGDHFGGMPFFLLEARERGKPRQAPLHVIGPPGLTFQVRSVLSALYPETDPDHWPFPVDWVEIAPGDSITRGGRLFQALRADHMSDRHPALCVRVKSDGKVLAFTGDTGPRAALSELARDADLLICECTWAKTPLNGPPQHLSVDEIARLRPSWNAKRVILTHLTEESRSLAASIPKVEIADDGAEFSC